MLERIERRAKRLTRVGPAARAAPALSETELGPGPLERRRSTQMPSERQLELRFELVVVDQEPATPRCSAERPGSLRLLGQLFECGENLRGGLAAARADIGLDEIGRRLDDRWLPKTTLRAHAHDLIEFRDRGLVAAQPELEQRQR